MVVVRRRRGGGGRYGVRGGWLVRVRDWLAEWEGTLLQSEAGTWPALRLSLPLTY